MSLVVAMMLPNWVIPAIRRPDQQALRRGIPDALDLLVVCAEAGLGLNLAVERVAQEMRRSNRPVSRVRSAEPRNADISGPGRSPWTNLSERSGQPAFKRLAGTMRTEICGTASQGASPPREMRNERC